MNCRKYGLRALGLSLLAALVLSAIAAGSAQAEGEWKIGGKTLTELGLKEETVAGSGSETFTITESSAAKLEITCNTLTIEKAAILSGGTSGKTFVLEACTLQGAIGKHCKILNPVKFTLKDHLFLHNSKTYDLLEPAVGTTFMTMKFEKIGTEGFCLIGEELAYKGTVVTETEAGERSEQPLIFKPSSELEKLFPTDALFLGANTAAIKGKALLHLTGGHKNQMWTGIG